MSDLVTKLRELDAKATKGPWTVADGGGIETDRLGRERPNPKPFVAEAHSAPPDGLRVARGFERARHNDATALVALRNAIPALIEYVEAADEIKRLGIEHDSDTVAPCAIKCSRCAAARLRYDAAKSALLAALEGRHE